MQYPIDFINKVILGDCLDVMSFIPDKSVDLILCDLPYETIACKWDIIVPFKPLWDQYKRIIKNNCAIALTASQPFTTKLIYSNFSGFKYIWYWNKDRGGNFSIAKYQPLRVIENICIFGKGTIKYNPQMEIAEKAKIGPPSIVFKQKDATQGMASGLFKVSANRNEMLRYPKNLINIKSTEKECNNANRVHPTQKPVKLFEYLIKTYTNEGDLVLDNCIGSGTTAIACLNTNRNYIGIEKEQKYYDICLNRLNNYLV